MARGSFAAARYVVGVLALMRLCAGRRLAETAPAPAPAPAAPSTGPTAGHPYFIGYSDPACIEGTTLAGATEPFFPPSSEVPQDAFIATTFAQVGLAPSAPAICGSPEVSLMTTCTASFYAIRAPGSDLLWLQPAVTINVGPSPACSLSRCQAGLITVDAAGGAGNGTFLSRKGFSDTFPVSIVGTSSEEGGAQVVEVSVETPLGFACTMLYSGNATAALAAPDSM